MQPDQGVTAGTGPAQVLLDALGARRIDFDRVDRQVFGDLGQVRGLAAGRGAGVEDAHTVLDLQQLHCQLGAGVLHRHLAGGEARDLGDRQRRVQPDRGRSDPARLDAFAVQPLQIGLDAAAPPVHPQHQRRHLALQLQDLREMRRLGLAQAVDPPARRVERDGRLPLELGRSAGSRAARCAAPR
jgi:hypothetical protein